MQIEISTDSHIEGSDAFAARAQSAVETAIGRFSSRISRVEVHLHDANRDKGGAGDKRCVIEVRLQGRPPTAVSHQAPTLELAIDGAAGKLKRSVETTLGRENSLAGRRDHR
jgi:ribosome-associated translation inhibitor RaiA